MLMIHFFVEMKLKNLKFLNYHSLDIVNPTLISSKGSGLVGYSARSIIFHEMSKKIKKS